jgi:pimeloyl-ACP methyl ester carboxylesterase
MEASDFAAGQIELHGHRAVYHIAGSGPPVVLIHGMLNSSRHWRSVALRLAERHTVIAPDLIGHGDSATPRGDYSLGAHASSIRDLLAVLNIERATIVGHSLGGGVAMQFFYQFPQRTERLVLISSGGLGHEVSPLLRTASLPGASLLAALATNPRLLTALHASAERLKMAGWQPAVYLQAAVRALRPLERPGARKAFLHTLRSVIDVQGQRVGASDRLYMLAHMPTLIIWGERDNTIPLAHGLAAQKAAPSIRFERLPRAAHFPHLESPEELAEILLDFIAGAEPARIEDSDWGEIVSAHGREGQGVNLLAHPAYVREAGEVAGLVDVHRGGPAVGARPRVGPPWRGARRRVRGDESS